MILVGIIFGGLLIFFGVGGTIFFDKLMYKTYNRVITGKEERNYRLILLAIFVLGLALTIFAAVNYTA